MQDLEKQLAALEEFKSFLELFKEEIGDKLIQYSNKVLSLPESGLSRQTADYYLSNFCEPNTQVLYNLGSNIKERDLLYIKENIASITEAIGKARMG